MLQRSPRWPAAVLIGAALVFFRHVVFTSHYTIPWDLRYYHLPLASIMAQAFARWEFPLWDPSTYCGRPFYALLQGQAFYPPGILAVLASNLAGGHHLLWFLNLQAVVHVALAGIFTYGLLRALRLGVTAAIAGALVYELGAFFVTQAQHLGAISAAAWLPLAWHAVVLLGRGFTWKRLAMLAAALAMSFLAGFTAVALVVFATTGMLAALLVALRAAPFRLLAFAALGALWAVLISAVQLLPTMELAGLSVASGRSRFASPGGGGMPLGALATLVWPNRWGVLQFGSQPWTLEWNPTFTYLYCGIPALLFAAAAWARRAGRETAAFTALLVLAGLWMLGGATPVMRFAYPLLPESVRGAMYVEFAMAAFVLALAVLAGMGADALLAGRGNLVATAAVLVVAADLVAAGSARPLNLSSLRDEPGITYDTVDGNNEAPVLLRKLTRHTVPPSRIDNMGGSPTWTGCSPAYEVPSANGDDPFAPVRLIEVRKLFGKGAPWQRFYDVADPASPVLDLLNVEYLLSRGDVPGPGLERVAQLSDMVIRRNRGALPRFFLVGRVHRARNMGEALAHMRAPGFDPRAEAVVEGPADASPGGAGSVRVVSYRAREVILDTDAAAPAMLVTSETWHPGWRAWVDGGERPLVLTNAAFRGLPLPAGRHTVRMRFEPPVLWRSGLVTLLALAALVALAAIGDNRTKASWISSSS